MRPLKNEWPRYGNDPTSALRWLAYRLRRKLHIAYYATADRRWNLGGNRHRRTKHHRMKSCEILFCAWLAWITCRLAASAHTHTHAHKHRYWSDLKERNKITHRQVYCFKKSIRKSCFFKYVFSRCYTEDVDSIPRSTYSDNVTLNSKSPTNKISPALLMQDVTHCVYVPKTYVVFCYKNQFICYPNLWSIVFHRFSALRPPSDSVSSIFRCQANVRLSWSHDIVSTSAFTSVMTSSLDVTEYITLI